MSSRVDTIVVGGGHNGLVAASYLAKAGRHVRVLERAEEVGGILRGPGLAPGFRAPGLIPTVGRLRPSMVRDLKLVDHGFETIAPDIRMVALQPDGPPTAFWGEPSKTAGALHASSPGDADAFVPFDAKVRAMGSFLAHVNGATPPDPSGPSIADTVMGLRLGKAFRDLGATVGREVIRALPMAVADLVQEAFSSEAVRGPLAARGVLFTAMGAWSAGTASVFLNDSAGVDGGAAGTTVFARGGTQALAAALASAASSLGVEISTGVAAVRIRSSQGRVQGVTLADGSEVDAEVVVSCADPKRTLGLCDPVELGPTLVWEAGNIRQPGAVAKVDLALGGMPVFDGVSEDQLRGRIVVAPSVDHVERAMDAVKYGRVADDPILEATIPSLCDPSVAPEGKHLMSVIVQAAPRRLRGLEWGAERERLGDLTVGALERYAPGLGDLVEARTVTTPEDMEEGYALSGGSVLHAEPGLDQFFAWRPLNGHARYAFGLGGLYLAGSGAHPGGGVTGGPGANAARQILRDLRRA